MKERDKSYRLLKCGHDRTELRVIEYKCNLNCGELHSTTRCQVCLAEGKDPLPYDFRREVKRKKVYYR